MPTHRPSREQLITLLEYAIEREEESRLRYEEAAKLAVDPEVRQLLVALAGEELGHRTRLEDLLARVRG